VPRPFDLSLYVITDGRLANGRDQVAAIEAAIRGGATMVQLRDKELPARDQYALGLRLRELTRRTGAALIVNDRVDLALAIDADGVHLGQDDLPPSIARQLLGPDAIVGVSAGNPTELALVEREGIDYVGTGPFAPTRSKSDAGAAIGPAGFAAVRALTKLPMVAIGAISATNAAEAVRAGAQGVAVISAVVGAADPEAAARELRQIVDRARAAGS
jgi:thiamine-phosphate pyrophosphorylase